MYRVGAELGEGTYGKVYCTSNLLSRRPLALKRLVVVPSTRSEHVLNLRELDMMTRLSHKHVMPLTDVLFTPPPFSPLALSMRDDRVCLVMPRADFSGDKYLRGNPSMRRRKLLIGQLVTGVQHIHRADVIHRDLKPQNLLIFRSKEGVDTLRIGDFGLAIPYVPCEPRTPQMVTIWYRAPEILLDQNYDIRSDVWSLGCILYEFATGRPLFPAATEPEMLSAIFELLGSAAEKAALPPAKRKKRSYVSMPQLTGAALLLHRDIGFSSEQIADFDATAGSYLQFLDLLASTLTINPFARPVCSSLLRHRFFDGYRETIAVVVSPRPRPHCCHFHPLRIEGVNLIEAQPQLEYRIKFLALDILDRILAVERDVERAVLRRYTICALYLAEKYLLSDAARPLAALTGTGSDDFTNYAATERYVLKHILDFRIYRRTLYDCLPHDASLADIDRIYLLFQRALPLSGIQLDHLYALYCYVTTHYYETWNGRLAVPLVVV